MESKPTRDRILDAAERVFGEYGFPNASMRRITDEAGVNLAAVNYHFRSKAELYKELLHGGLRKIDEERMILLNQAEQLAGEQPVPVRSILETFIRPMLRHAATRPAGGVHFLCLVNRELIDPQPFMMAGIMLEFEPLIERYTRVLAHALPNLPPAELSWRMQFTIGGILHAVARKGDRAFIPGGLCQENDLDGCVHRLIDYCAAGLEAPPSASAVNLAH